MRLVERAQGRCECGGCGHSIPPGHADHFFGRAKADESEATVWLLTPDCDYSKTRNSPDASHWLRLYIEHCRKHGYAESQRRAEARLHFVDTRRKLGTAL